jgi:hypothetical protein
MDRFPENGNSTASLLWDELGADAPVEEHFLIGQAHALGYI